MDASDLEKGVKKSFNKDIFIWKTHSLQNNKKQINVWGFELLVDLHYLKSWKERKSDTNWCSV